MVTRFIALVVIFDALARGLFYDIYLVQQISLTTNEPLPAYDIWPTRSRQTLRRLPMPRRSILRLWRCRRSLRYPRRSIRRSSRCHQSRRRQPRRQPSP